MNRLKPLFPQLTTAQWETLEQMAALHREWNAKINLVSRKDIENLEWHHYAPSIAAVNFLQLAPGARVLDAGTGGGFPGLILAVLYPQAEFTLADSIGKKITVVADIAARLNLKNVLTKNVRVETLGREFDFVTGRAVSSLQQFIAWVRSSIRRGTNHSLENGVIYWQGGSLETEKTNLGIAPATILSLESLLGDSHFFEKHILHYRATELHKAIAPPLPVQ
jgi:16S rRNA (guanine527-N7)-methyltransferase